MARFMLLKLRKTRKKVIYHESTPEKQVHPVEPLRGPQSGIQQGKRFTG